MSDQTAQYEELLATYSHAIAAIELLKHHRPYLEMVPSMRRPEESVITIPLPIVKIRQGGAGETAIDSQLLPCEIAILMCDPEWKIKTGKEIFVFIHKPDEDFSELLGRWRRTQLRLNQDYEWLMPSCYQHILNDRADKTYPLFVLFDDTPERIKRGLQGAHLPFVTHDSAVDFSQVESTT